MWWLSGILIFLVGACSAAPAPTAEVKHSRHCVEPGSPIVLEVERYRTVPSGRLEDHKEALGFQIDQGYLDKRQEFVTASNGTKTVISKINYDTGDREIRDLMEEKLLSILKQEVWAYRAMALIDNSRKPAEHLLSSFAQKWIFKDSTDGPNCYYAALAAIIDDWDEPRFMSDHEFLQHLETSFVEVGMLEKTRDLLVLFSDSGEPEHAAVYIGSTAEGIKILFTKNGRRIGKYLFMDFETIANKLYPETKQKFFRLK